MAELAYRDALNQALAEEIARDPRVFLMGEEVARYDGAYKVSKGLLEKFGSARVVDAPISELGFGGLGVGAAMAGLRPVIEMMTWNFAILAMDQIVNSAAKLRHMSGGQLRCPIVFRGPNGAGGRLSSQHSQALEANYAHFPGLKVIAPCTPADAKGLLKSAIRDDNPVIFIEHESLYGIKGEVDDGGEELVPFGQARIRREGTDVTIVGILKMANVAMEAAETLEKEHGVSAEVIDPRTLRPLDLDSIIESVAKTNHAVIVEEGWPHGGVGANLSALITEQAFDHLDAPPQRVTGADVHMPYSRRLEQAAIPHQEHIVSAALATLEGAMA